MEERAVTPEDGTMSSNTSEALEMYIKTVYDLEKNGERARTKEIARKLGVKEPSVTEMLQKLKRKSFVKYKRYHGATLTSKGRRLAKDLTGP
ncbi:MAG: metal-dependent transcriptional regulator [Candidatus Korarchaeota archaeon]|nr:metal-dependent transcriptional regulator [Candidatus Korarchaeota archaeon]NIU81921.1 hypothetical protein [Candidatus Thorarchaeota archaeon]NIW51171.1 hypothetical protein [Candidatus Korarchaeota archaeon]